MYFPRFGILYHEKSGNPEQNTSFNSARHIPRYLHTYFELDCEITKNPKQNWNMRKQWVRRLSKEQHRKKRKTKSISPRWPIGTKS
jgi:hypothetical protein